MKKADIIKKLDQLINEYYSISYSDIFVSVRQRINAFKLYQKFNCIGYKDKDDYLDGCLRFLNRKPTGDFIYYCARHDKVSPIGYWRSLADDISKTYRLKELSERIAAARCYSVLYDGGKYDSKEDLIKSINAIRDILSEKKTAVDNKYVLHMFKQWLANSFNNGRK